MTKARVGKRYQVVIPMKEREKIGIQPNTQVEIVAEGNRLILYPVDPSHLRGIGRAVADGRDATDYVGKLRREWEDRA
jgi:AbrB family looped-hinge helix DNA binding protein